MLVVTNGTSSAASQRAPRKVSFKKHRSSKESKEVSELSTPIVYFTENHPTMKVTKRGPSVEDIMVES